MEMPIQSLRYELSDYTEPDLLNEFLVQVALHYGHWISNFRIESGTEGSYASVLYNNGNDEIWHRLRQGDHLMFLGKEDLGIPGVEAMPGITQVVTSPQTTASEAAMADMMGMMGLPGPAEIQHTVETSMLDGADPDAVLEELFKTEEDNPLIGLIREIFERLEDTDD